MWIWVAPLAGGFAFLIAVGRYNRAAALRDWELLLTPAGDRALDGLTRQVALDAMLADRAWLKACRSRAERRFFDAVRFLELSAAVVEQSLPDRLKRLRGMAVCCRMASALVPLPPLLPREFRLARLVTLVGFASVVHHLLVSVHERFLLRLWVLRLGFRAARDVLSGSAARMRRAPELDGDWKAFEAGLHDFKAVDREHLEAFRALLVSVRTEDAA